MSEQDGMPEWAFDALKLGWVGPYQAKQGQETIRDLMTENATQRAELAAQAQRIAELEPALWNLLATIFGDGGHRRSEINDDAKASREAINLYHQKRQADHKRAYEAETERDSARLSEQRMRTALAKVRYMVGAKLAYCPCCGVGGGHDASCPLAAESAATTADAETSVSTSFTRDELSLMKTLVLDRIKYASELENADTDPSNAFRENLALKLAIAARADAAASSDADEKLLWTLNLARAGFRKLIAHHRDDHHQSGEMPHDETVASGLLALERQIVQLRRARGESWDDLIADAAQTDTALVSMYQTQSAASAKRDLDIILDYVRRVDERAESDILSGSPVEGAHYRAMRAEIPNTTPHYVQRSAARATREAGREAEQRVIAAGLALLSAMSPFTRMVMTPPPTHGVNSVNSLTSSTPRLEVLVSE